MGVSDAFPALISVRICSSCGKVPELCGCDSLRVCGICWLPIEHCYCANITIFLDEHDVEFIPPPLPAALVPNLWRLDEDAPAATDEADMTEIDPVFAIADGDCL